MPFTKGYIPWNKGTLRSEKDKAKMKAGWAARFLEGKPSYGKQNAIKGREKIRQSKLGARNPMWKGDAVGYSGLHLWVQARLGKPMRCESCGKSGLKGKQIDWANISGKYLEIKEDSYH